jgi:hypothetical protein
MTIGRLMAEEDLNSQIKGPTRTGDNCDPFRAAVEAESSSQRYPGCDSRGSAPVALQA